MPARGLRSAICLSTFALVFFAAALYAVAPSKQAKPEETARKCVLLLQQEKYKESFDMILDSERKGIALEDYIIVCREQAWRTKLRLGPCTVYRDGDSKAMVRFVMNPGGRTEVVLVRLVKAADGDWWVTDEGHLPEDIARAKGEVIQDALRALGEHWIKRDYAAMASAFTNGYLKSHYGSPPYKAKMQAMRNASEKACGRLEGIGCAWQWVRYTDGSTATTPVKFCYFDSVSKTAKSVPYVATLRRDSVSKQWKISDLVKTEHLQLPPKIDPTVSPERRKLEDASIGGK